MELGWIAVIQGVIITGCTWYMRQGSKRDTETVVRSTAAQSTSDSILDRVRLIEIDVALIKRSTVKRADLDHRGPDNVGE